MKRVLIVDDSEFAINAIVRSFRCRYDMLISKSGDHAIEVASREKPDVILLDIMMPGKNGIETCHALKENPETRNIPVIFITSISDQKIEESCFLEGARDYVLKPFSIGVLRHRIDNVLKYCELKES